MSSVLILTSATLLITTAVCILNVMTIAVHESIAMTLFSTLLIYGFILLNTFGLHTPYINDYIKEINFNSFVMNLAIPFLLFCGGMQMTFQDIKKHALEISCLSVISTCLSMVLIAAFTHAVFSVFNTHIALSWVHCFLLGAILSPTDPIAVVALMRKLHAPDTVRTILSGESLFNDGIGIVLFTVTSTLLMIDHWQYSTVVLLFLQQSVLGGISGYLMGTVGATLIRHFKDHALIIVLITLCITTSGYQLANHFEISGALAMVVAGLVISSTLNRVPKTSIAQYVRSIWLMIDDILNVCLFLLIGFIHLTTHAESLHIANILIIPIVLVARYLSVGASKGILWSLSQPNQLMVDLLTWGGLRGALSIALALSLPESMATDTLKVLTLYYVTFSIIVQGLTIGPFISHKFKSGDQKAA